MAINTNTPRNEFTATASQTDFTFNFKIFADTDIVAYLTPTGQEANDTNDLLTLTAEYTITIDGDNGGTLTLVTPATSGDKITITRNLPIERNTDFQQGGDILAETVNNEEEYQYYLMQQNQANLARYVKLPESAQGLDISLPNPLADTYFKWNSSGTAIENDTTIPDNVQLAKDWANKAEDLVVADEEYSSKHYSIKSSNSATASETSYQNSLAIYNSLATTFTVDTMADLVALDPSKSDKVWLLGYHTKSDKEPVLYHYDATLAEENGGTKVLSSFGSGGWYFKPSGSVNVKDFGATGDGVTDDTASIKLAIESAIKSTESNPYTSIVYIPVGEYKITEPILLYGYDGIRIIGDGRMNTVFHIASDFSIFTYPAEWQALSDYTDVVANPAVFQIAYTRRTFRNSLTVSGVSGSYEINPSGNDFYSDTDAEGWNAFCEISDIGIIANPGFEKQIHGIYGKTVTQAKFNNLKMRGVNIGIALPTAWSSKIEDIMVHESKQPIFIGGATSMFINRCNAVLCERGYNIRANYSSINSLSLDHWNSGYFAYDLGGHPLVVNGCGHEHGMGGSLRIGKNALIDGSEGTVSDRTGITFNSCNFNVSTDEGTIYYQGQTSVSNYGVEAIHLIEAGEVVFNGCETKAQSYPSGGPIIFFGAKVKYDSHVLFIGNSDTGSGAGSNKTTFSDYVICEGNSTDGMPTINFTTPRDKVFATVRIASSIDLGNINTTAVIPFDTVDYDPHSLWDSVNNKFVLKHGGIYKVTTTINASGDSNSYQAIQVTDRVSGYSTEQYNRSFDDSTTTSKTITFTDIFECHHGESIRVVSRYYGSGSDNLVFKEGTSICLEQIA